MFKRWVIRLADKWRSNGYDECVPMPEENRKRRNWGGRNTLTSTAGSKSNHRVSHNYDDTGVITFKVYGANGGKIVEAARYDDKSDNERIKLYIIEENANFTESLSKIVTMEYLR